MWSGVGVRSMESVEHTYIRCTDADVMSFGRKSTYVFRILTVETSQRRVRCRRRCKLHDVCCTHLNPSDFRTAKRETSFSRFSRVSISKGKVNAVSSGVPHQSSMPLINDHEVVMHLRPGSQSLKPV